MAVPYDTTFGTPKKISEFPELDGLYKIEGTIGQGAYAKVRSGIHILTGEKVAIKTVTRPVKIIPSKEYKALFELKHQNICRLYEVIETDTRVHMILQHCGGGELANYLSYPLRLKEEDARRLFRQIVSAVAFTHSLGYAHRDLKPANILLDVNGNVKLIDYGFCIKPQGGLGHLIGSRCGTPAYMAPEIPLHLPYHAGKADIWSLGIILYIMLSGSHPFPYNSARDAIINAKVGLFDPPKGVSKQAKELLSALLKANPTHRISIHDLVYNEWLCEGSVKPLDWPSKVEETLDEECIAEIARFYGLPFYDIADVIKEWDYDYHTATYLLMVEKKKRGLPIGPLTYQSAHVAYAPDWSQYSIADLIPSTPGYPVLTTYL